MKKRWESLVYRLGASLCCLALLLAFLPPALAAGAQAAASNNKISQSSPRYGTTVKSYLYANNKGGLTRVEYINNSIVVEDYNSSFALQSSRTIPMELSIWGGFYAGKDYNFFVFGQTNPQMGNDVEEFRVVKYSKDWQRLGAASLTKTNTITPFDTGSLRCAEYGGYLYVRTCHNTFLRHQGNAMFNVRQSDMTLTDSLTASSSTSSGYVSHSFNQFILIDQEKRIVTLDHGDTYPRSAVLMRYRQPAGQDGFRNWTGSDVDYVDVQPFAGGEGNNFTGASLGGLEETANGYVTAYNYDGVGGSGTRDVYLAFVSKSNLSSKTAKLPGSAGGSAPALVSTGLNGGYILWNQDDALHYAAYNANGQAGDVKTVDSAFLSDCQPVVYNGKVVWYTTSGTAPIFYTLDSSGVNAVAADPKLNPWGYRITFDGNGGSLSANQMTTSPTGVLSSWPQTIPQAGYQFKGWFTQPEGGEQIATTKVFQENTTLYAQWRRAYTRCTITLNANGGTVSRTSVTTNDYGLASLPTPTWLGHAFDGWYTAKEGGERVDSTTEFAQATTLYAHWTVRVTFNAGLGTVEESSIAVGADGKLPRLPSATYSGYVLDGWYTEYGGRGSQITTDMVFTKGTIVYAKWVKAGSQNQNGFTITFDGNGGTPGEKSKVTDKNGKLDSLPSGTRDGYTFGAWYAKPTGGRKITTDTVFTEDSTIYAFWVKEDSWTVTFNANGGAVGETSKATDKSGKLAQLPQGTRTGYILEGWYTAPTGGEKVTTGTVFTRDTTIYARWVQEGSRIVTFNANGGTAGETSKATDQSGKLTSLPSATRNGYTFDGWYTTMSGGERITTGTAFTKDTTVYARWSEVPAKTAFTDLEPGAYYTDAVKWAVEKGVTSGTSKTTFSPNSTCTRAQAVTFLWRAAGSPTPKGSGTSFRDVQPDAYYYDAVRWAVEQGITSGTSATAFSPNEIVTREQTVTFLYRAAGSPNVSGHNPFRDVPAGAYSADAVKWAVSNQVTSGTSATTFSPTQNCTRGQLVTFLYRAR